MEMVKLHLEPADPGSPAQSLLLALQIPAVTERVEHSVLFYSLQLLNQQHSRAAFF